MRVGVYLETSNKNPLDSPQLSGGKLRTKPFGFSTVEWRVFIWKLLAKTLCFSMMGGR
mgnify:CR=1 FL=1